MNAKDIILLTIVFDVFLIPNKGILRQQTKSQLNLLKSFDVQAPLSGTNFNAITA